MRYSAANALKHYAWVGIQSGVDSASPHRLVQMLLDGLLTRLAQAKGHLERGETADKGAQLGKAITIIDGMRAHLDLETGGDIAANLDALYDYMVRQLLKASLRNDVALVREVDSLARELKRGWDAIGEGASGGEQRSVVP